MIKFFRNIRKAMINQNRASQYLFYAIGEIVLVVIGILIALQINNWNELRKGSIAEDKYVNNLIQDLKNDLEFYNSRKAYLERNLSIYNTFIYLSKADIQDSIWQKTMPLILSFERGMAFQSALVENNPDFRAFINNPEIIEGIKKLHFDYEYLEKAISKSNEVKEMFGFELDKRYFQRIPNEYDDSDKKPKYVDYQLAVNDEEVINTLGIFRNTDNNSLIQVDKFRNSTSSLMAILEEWKETDNHD